MYVDGFSASSLFEARLAREILGKKKSVHLTSPGIRHDEISQLSDTCDYIAFNSLSQFDKYSREIDRRVSSGLRINPQLSFVKDERYNPCRKYSKLGVPLDLLAGVSWHDSDYDRNLQGILFHNNCESNDFSELQRTLEHLYIGLPEIFGQIRWVNFGGGYVFKTEQDLEKLHDCVTFVKDRCSLNLGKASLGKPGQLFQPFWTFL
jgi:carboxynorspermidine decarboxylase